MKLEWALIAVLLVGLIGLSAKVGNMAGMAEVQDLWDKEAKITGQTISDLKVAVTKKETEHTLLSEKIAQDLLKSKEEHEKALAAVRADYDLRLFSSSNRANVYERLSRGTATERDRLAVHSAELDRTLEEGRYLVGELRQTLGQCEVTVGILGTQILLDRNLLE